MFVFSKLLSAITQPLFWLSLWWLLTLVLLPRFRRLEASMLWGGMLVLGLLGFTAVPDTLLRYLESRFNVPSVTQSDPYPGMIVLVGALVRPGIYKAHGQVPLQDAAERMTVPVSPRDIQSLEQQIDGDFLLRQRTGFESERFVLPPRNSPLRAE